MEHVIVSALRESGTLEINPLEVLAIIIGIIVGIALVITAAVRVIEYLVGWRETARNDNKLVGSQRRKGSSGVFISYRRNDQAALAGRLYDKIVAKLGKHNVFMDVDSVQPGVDFAEAINNYLARCQVLVVVIGKSWLDASDSVGRRRLDSTTDYVRLEIETALRRKVRVIPILVDGAQIPKAEELPASMESLTRRHGIAVSHANFGSDAAKLIATLDRIMKAGG